MWKVVKGTQVWSYEVWYCLKFKYNSVSKLPNTLSISGSQRQTGYTDIGEKAVTRLNSRL